MNIVKVILNGLASIFCFSPQPRQSELDALKEKYIDEFKTLSDKERLAKDWRAVSRDMSEAFNRIKAEYGQK